MEQTNARMPDELEDSKKHFYFYSDDGGFQATHEDDRAGEEIYYLGIIDCLTHVSLVVRFIHRFKLTFVVLSHQTNGALLQGSRKH